MTEKLIELLGDLGFHLTEYQQRVLTEFMAEYMTKYLLLAFGVGLALGMFIRNLIIINRV